MARGPLLTPKCILPLTPKTFDQATKSYLYLICIRFKLRYFNLKNPCKFIIIEEFSISLDLEQSVIDHKALILR